VRTFLQIFITLVLLSSVSFAEQFKDIKKISLKKDEQKKILVKYGKYERLFKFRWTLYVNEGLVLLRSYDRVVAQNILYLNNTNQSFKQVFKTRGADLYEPPYMLVKFKEFDFEKNEAVFELFLHDKKNQIEIKYLKNS